MPLDTADITWPEDMPLAQRDALLPLLKAFDAAAEALEQDPRAIFPSEEERKAVFYGALTRWGRAWSKPGRCMHKGCGKNSISRSHSISLGTSISQIAEAGHVLTPQYGKHGVELVRIGKRDASTFPGFCDEHEALFIDFENKRALTEERHFQLQVFRTLCREIYAKRHAQRKLTDMLSDYQRLREAFMERSLTPHRKSDHGSPAFDIKFDGDPMEKQIIDLLQSGAGDLVELGALYDAIVSDLRAGTYKVTIEVRAFDQQLPVCLSGLGVLNYRDKDGDHKCLCCLAVLPEVHETKILLAVASENKDVAALHMSADTSPEVLSRIESWMLNGTDHWFMRPSAWAMISTPRQRLICERVPLPGSLIEEPPFSVLDAARLRIISGLTQAIVAGTYGGRDEERANALLAAQEAKLIYS